MAISSEALLAALRSASASSTSSTAYQAEDIIMKLAKKNDRAVLKFEIIGTTSVGRRVKVSHDVLVDVMKPHEVAKLAEPLCPEPDVGCSPCLVLFYSYPNSCTSSFRLSRSSEPLWRDFALCPTSSLSAQATPESYNFPSAQRPPVYKQSGRIL